MAITRDIEINQGSDWTMTLILKNDDKTVINLTGYTAKMQARKTQSNSAQLYDTLSTEAGNERIVITALEGKIVLTTPNLISTAYLFDSAYYDLEIVSAGGLITRLMQGVYSYNKGVTVNV